MKTGFGWSVVLASQMRVYGISGDYPEEFTFFEQAANIDDTPVHNLAKEKQCGLAEEVSKPSSGQ